MSKSCERYEGVDIFYGQRWIWQDGVECGVCIIRELYSRKEDYGA